MGTKGEVKIFDNYIWVARKLFAIVAFIVLVLFVIGEIIYPDERDTVNTECEVYETDWYRVFENGERTKVEVPGKVPAEFGEVVIIETTLPDDIFDREYLCFRVVWQDVEIYVDGELRKSYTTKDSRPFGTNSAFRYLFVPLYEEDAGKELAFQFSSNSKYAGDIRTVYIGDRTGIWIHFLMSTDRKQLWRFCCSLSACFVFVYVQLCSTYMVKSFR